MEKAQRKKIIKNNYKIFIMTPTLSEGIRECLSVSGFSREHFTAHRFQNFVIINLRSKTLNSNSLFDLKNCPVKSSWKMLVNSLIKYDFYENRFHELTRKSTIMVIHILFYNIFCSFSHFPLHNFISSKTLIQISNLASVGINIIYQYIFNIINILYKIRIIFKFTIRYSICNFSFFSSYFV